MPSTLRSGAPEAVLRLATTSTEDEFGTEDDIDAALGALDTFALGLADAVGLRPLFGEGVFMALDSIVGLEGTLVLRTEFGVDCLEYVFRAMGVDGEDTFDLVGGKLMEASKRCISAGIEMPWTMLTAVHSTS